MIINLTIHGLEIDYRKLSDAITSSLHQTLSQHMISNTHQEKIEAVHVTIPSLATFQEIPESETKEAQRIRSLMILKGVKCIDIAKQTEVSRTWVSLVLNGHKNSIRIRKAIADALGMKVEDLWPNKNKTKKR